ncbi:MAG: hypothetical protein J6S63_11130 [Atopobiaceae bacterium]|nr:hypothetical protein [Atopobiaceae bacterium]
MTERNTHEDTGGVSAELDELSSTLMGDALDMLAEDGAMGVLVVLQDAAGEVSSYEFADDGPAALLDEARSCVRRSRHGVRYALTYVGAIEMDDGTYAEALLMEFGERGKPSYSAYSLFEGAGTGDDFRWTDPAPAGEEEPLLG